MVNADLIESLEAVPDTVVTLVNKRRFVVEDSLGDVIDRIVAYRARIAAAVNAPHDHAVGARAFSTLATDTEAEAA